MRFDAAIDVDGDVWIKRPSSQLWVCVTTEAGDTYTDEELNRGYGPVSYTELAESE